MPATLRAGDAELTVEPALGARWTSWRVGDLELLGGARMAGVRPEHRSGCFVMAPWAGRLGHGRLPLGGRVHELPANAGPHAIHGTVAAAGWAVVETAPDALRVEVALTAPWPARGRVEQALRLFGDRLESELTVHADEPMPVTVGWHPWFRRRLAHGEPAAWVLRGGRRLVRGADALPTGQVTDPGDGPWDDAFQAFEAPPALRWAGALTLTVESSAGDFVLFDERPEAVCLEPQSGPPDAVRLGQAADVGAGGSAGLRCVWRWAPA